MNLEKRQGEIMNELLDIREEEESVVTYIDGEEFDNRKWLENELDEINREIGILSTSCP
jgi:hypothetical protein